MVAGSRSGRWIAPEMLVVSRPLARRLRVLVEPGVRQLRREGIVLEADLADWLADLDRFASSADPGEPAPLVVPDRWISTRDAAVLLGVRERTVLGLRGLSSRKRGNRREWLESEVLAEAAAREEFRRSSEVSGGGSSAVA